MELDMICKSEIQAKKLQLAIFLGRFWLLELWSVSLEVKGFVTTYWITMAATMATLSTSS
jgi:hypothetical protein